MYAMTHDDLNRRNRYRPGSHYRRLRRAESRKEIALLHVFRDLDAQYSRRTFQLPAEKIRHPQQEHFLLAVLLLDDGIPLVEVAEGLRQLKRVAGDVGRFAGSHRAGERRI